MADPDDEAGAYVLGDDGDWRHLDVDGLVPVCDGTYTSPASGRPAWTRRRPGWRSLSPMPWWWWT